MGEAIGEGRTEDDEEPVLGHEPPFDHLVTRRGLHPAVGGKDPERGKEGAAGHHQRRNEMRPARHQPAPEQQDAEKGRFEKERHQPLIG
jgi:hypothetical protein